MADRSIIVRLRADISDYQRKFGQAADGAKKAAQSTGDFVTKNQGSIDTLSNKLGLLGAGMVGFAAVAVKKFADFDQSISNVAASGDDAKQNIDALREAALKAGADTVFSASEAADAVTELAKAGLSAADILDGALTGALDLAAAGSLDVAQAAEITSVALNQFGLDGADAGHVADLLAAGAGKASGEVSDMGMALKQTGLVADQTGLSIEETTGGLAAFAQAGLIGSDAGTSFKSMLQRLTPQSKEAAKLMADLGISAYDSQGQFVGLAKFAGNLKDSLKDLTPEQRNSALATIFGSDAVRAASVIYENGAEGVQKWIDAVDDQGFAAETAATKLDNLKGDWEAFSGSLDTAFINMGAGANGPLRELVQRGTDVVNAFSGLPEILQQGTLGLIGGGGLVLLGLAGMGKLLGAVRETQAAFKAMGITAKTASIGVGAVGAALAVATIAVSAWATAQAEAKARTEAYMDSLDELGNRTNGTVQQINDALSGDRRDFMQRLFGRDAHSLIDDAKEFGLAIEDLQGFILGQADAVEKVNAQTKEYIDGFSGNESRAAEEEVNNFTGALKAQASALTDAEKQAGQKAVADTAAGVAAGDLADQTGIVTAAFEDQTTALEDLIAAQAQAAGVVLSVRDAQRGAEAAVDAATESLEKNKATLDITTDAGRANSEALDNIASSGWDLIDSMQATGASQEELQGSLQKTRDDFIAVAEKMGLSKDEAAKLADQLKLIPDDIEPTVTLQTADAYKQLNALNAALDRAAGKHVVIPYSPQTHPTTVGQADGGLWGFANGGGIDASGAGVARQSMIAAGGRNIVWAEPTTGWEAYISGKPSARNRNIGILGDVASRFGYGLTRFDQGGFAGSWSAPQSNGDGTRGPLYGDIYLTAADPRAAVKELDADLRLKMSAVGGLTR